MYATLNFSFPNRQKPKEARDVAVRILVQAPEQRPKATLNFFFMCSGQLPSRDAVSHFPALSSELAALSSSCGGGLHTAGAKPFAESSVVRIEKDVMMEIGTSMTRTIFGGFIQDEPASMTTTSSSPSSSLPAAAAAGMHELHAGTVLTANMGMPNTNGSRYYILLGDIKPGDDELTVYQPLGRVVSGIDGLVAACATAAVQPRTLAPLQAVRIHVPEVCIDCRVGQADGNSTGSGSRQRVLPPRMAGRTRRREEVEEENEKECNDDREGEEGRTTAAEADGGVFKHTMTFPKPADDWRKNILNTGAKRVRTERYMTSAANEIKPLPTMAVEQTDGKPFDYFAAQEAAFINDVGIIAESQAVRRQRHNRHERERKKRTAGTTGSSRVLNGNKTKKTTTRRY